MKFGTICMLRKSKILQSPNSNKKKKYATKCNGISILAHHVVGVHVSLGIDVFSRNCVMIKQPQLKLVLSPVLFPIHSIQCPKLWKNEYLVVEVTIEIEIEIEMYR